MYTNHDIAQATRDRIARAAAGVFFMEKVCLVILIDTIHHLTLYGQARAIEAFLPIPERSPLCMLPMPLNIITTTLFPIQYLWIRFYKKRVGNIKENNNKQMYSICGTAADIVVR